MSCFEPKLLIENYICSEEKIQANLTNVAHEQIFLSTKY